ncbi:DUF2332 domain-containing protein [Actinomycetospora sp. NBRC 106375]|uniref:DUF2332 domain-containing protein n=1 Tax=Actinomycetospora sp. NBRC 106375 TaxID=3032207 RepID=UPI0025559058|nr:DUF2332 domain-containing protein [Actinomycetospora sp. NBRC 106375]
MSGTSRSLAAQYRRFADAEGTSPLQARLALAISRSADALHAVEAAPPQRRGPALVLAALHDLALAERAPALEDAAVDTLVHRADEVAAIAARRRHRPDEAGRHAVLHPAVAEAAHRTGADAIGLIDLGRPAGLNLAVDRVGVRYDAGATRGDPASPVQRAATVVGGRPVPAHPVPDVVARIAVDREPLDVADTENARWLRACLPPDATDQRRDLDTEIALVATLGPRYLGGDPVDRLTEALAHVPDDALPVVTTTWALSRLSAARRQRFADVIGATDRPVAWVSVEGVGVAPGVPTLGDRPASGHSIIGLALPGGPPDVLGRCWSRGRLLSWFGG